MRWKQRAEALITEANTRTQTLATRDQTITELNAKVESLGQELEASKTKIGELEKKVEEAEKGVQNKESTVQRLQSELSKAQSGGQASQPAATAGPTDTAQLVSPVPHMTNHRTDVGRTPYGPSVILYNSNSPKPNPISKLLVLPHLHLPPRPLLPAQSPILSEPNCRPRPRRPKRT